MPFVSMTSSRVRMQFRTSSLSGSCHRPVRFAFNYSRIHPKAVDCKLLKLNLLFQTQHYSTRTYLHFHQQHPSLNIRPDPRQRLLYLLQ